MEKFVRKYQMKIFFFQKVVPNKNNFPKKCLTKNFLFQGVQENVFLQLTVKYRVD